uniref:Uncharacterized protein n=1 Tax=Anguilla anguilla TaxID=7936 RepID=A0A0E9TA25_ANGAN
MTRWAAALRGEMWWFPERSKPQGPAFSLALEPPAQPALCVTENVFSLLPSEERKSKK